jgi:hypothetical protein
MLDASNLTVRTLKSFGDLLPPVAARITTGAGAGKASPSS